MRHWKIIACVLIGLTTGCGRNVAVPTDVYYRLGAPRVAQSLARPLTEGVLFVGTFRSDGLSGERPLVYSDAPDDLTLRQYHYHHWEDPPPRLLRRQLVHYLRAAKAAGTVMSGKEAKSDQVVRGRLWRFEHVLRKNDTFVRVALELRLEDREGRALLLKDYEVEKVAARRDVASVVAAMDEAVNELYGQFLADAARATSALSAAP
ncbi:MAG: ABC-type transport auxiliary lipoprotein family protein [Chromatiales bacterium]